jgi:hypothetical protein
MRYVCFDQTIENVFHFTRELDYDEDACAELANQIVAVWDAFMRPTLSNDITLLDVTVTAIHEASGAQFIAPAGDNGSHVAAGFDSLGSTLAIKFGTGRSGRSYRGRMYWPQLLAPAVVDNEVDLTTTGIYVAAMQDFFENIESSVGDVHVVVSYQNDCEWRTEGVPTPVTSYSVADFHVDSQRRRLSGRGI